MRKWIALIVLGFVLFGHGITAFAGAEGGDPPGGGHGVHGGHGHHH